MRAYRYKMLALVVATAIMPAFLLRCDRAALNLQRGFWQGVGMNLSALVVDAVSGQHR